jgi:hypothetical protein
VVDGTVVDGTVVDGTVVEGTVVDGTVMDGTVLLRLSWVSGLSAAVLAAGAVAALGTGSALPAVPVHPAVRASAETTTNVVVPDRHVRTAAANHTVEGAVPYLADFTTPPCDPCQWFPVQ